MTSIKIALIGYGSIGTRHASLWRKQDQSALVAICDSDGARRNLAAGQETARIYADFRELLANETPDLVDICTPHDLHAPMALAAIAAGRHVLVEKPMSLTSADARSMIDAAARAKVRLMVVKQNRYNAPVRAFSGALAAGHLGRPLMAQCSVLWSRNDAYYTASPWRGRKNREGGALYTQASHFIDLLTWWFGPVTDARGRLATNTHNIETEDSGVSELRFASGVLGTLVWSTCAARQNIEGSIAILGTEGYVKVGGPYLNVIERWDVPGMPPPPADQSTDKPNQYEGYQGSASNHHRVFADVVDDLLCGTKKVTDGSEALASVQAIEMVYQNCVRTSKAIPAADPTVGSDRSERLRS